MQNNGILKTWDLLLGNFEVLQSRTLGLKTWKFGNLEPSSRKFGNLEKLEIWSLGAENLAIWEYGQMLSCLNKANDFTKKDGMPAPDFQFQIVSPQGSKFPNFQMFSPKPLDFQISKVPKAGKLEFWKY